ncbi:hypothetical protein GE09DRAFT_1211319 [Coniochaeta sp. 2T2.1]|nr:hypothetical protein GE09DRAFT_1211319 [Coniochaeta sp. 2T2.1]
MEIPGYFYDAEKKKYFKISKNPASYYSTDNVKRLKLQHEAEEKRQIAAANTRERIKRSEILRQPATGGFLAREYGLRPPDLPVACFARELRGKGHVPIWRNDSWGNEVEHLCVVDAASTPHGIAIGSYSESEIGSAYLPRDEYDRVIWDPTQPFDTQRPSHLASVSQISSMKYSHKSNSVLITSREPGNEGGIYSLLHRTWNSGHSGPNLSHLHSWPATGKFARRQANTCAPAPAANSNLVCVVGTGRGLGCLTTAGQMLWVEEPPGAGPSPRPKKGQPAVSSDILSLDFLLGSPQVVLAGARGSRRICIADLRQRGREWEWLVHRSPPAHVRCLGEHHVLAAGPSSSMSVYDLRFRFRETYRNSPLVTFPEFRNWEKMHFGLDVDTSLGVVATADCPSRKMGAAGGGHHTVSIFSLETGKRLEAPGLENPAETGNGAKSLVFHRLPGETNASLFVGGGRGAVVKYSFGGNVDEWNGDP